MNTVNKYFLLSFLITAIMITSCAPQPAESVQPADNNSGFPAEVEFTLKTESTGTGMAFIGVGGAIDGLVNPDLNVQAGDTVSITLVNGDGIMHDIAFPEQGAQSGMLSKKDQAETFTFTVPGNGIYPYFCTVAGHRQAGMEGQLVVGLSTGGDSAVTDTSIVKSPDDLPEPLQRSEPETVQVELETLEVEARLSDGSSYRFWTFNGKLPGPFIRVRVGDTVEVSLTNDPASEFSHSVDFHAVTGPGGGAASTQTGPGETTSFTFKALKPGLYVYHCATPMVAHHIANGMYGLILVEPEQGLPPVDHEFYVMQGEVYTAEEYGDRGTLTFDIEKLLNEDPEYFIFNGAVGSLTEESPLYASVGDTVRIFFGVGGPNFISSFHVIGEIFDQVYNLASLTSSPLTDVQTTIVPPGGAVVVEISLDVPGRYLLVDHALSRMERGLVGYLIVDGPENPEVFDGNVNENSGQ